MSIPGSAHPLLATAILEDSDLITKSLRFDRNRETELNAATTGLYEGNSRIWTWSAWVKRNASDNSSEQPLFGNQQGDRVGFNANGKLYIYLESLNIYGSASLTTAYEFLDYSAWYHIVVAVDTTLTSSNDRIKLYVNGIRQVTFDQLSLPVGRRPTNFNSGWSFYVGRQRVSNVDTFFDGYMADVHFIDGQELNQYNFGKFVDGLWQPKAFNGDYFAADIPGTSSPYVYQSVAGTYGNLSSLTTDGGVYGAVDNSGGFLRLGFDTPYTGVTNVKFKGGGYSQGSSYSLFINGVKVGSTRSTITNWGEESITIPSTDISSIEVRSHFNGYALGSVKFNDTLITGTPSLGTPARGQGSFHLNFEDNSSVAALGTDTSGNGHSWTVNNLKVHDGTGNYNPAHYGTYYSGIATSVFDGDITTVLGMRPNNSGVSFNAVTVNSSLRVYSYTQSGIIYLNKTINTGQQSLYPNIGWSNCTSAITSFPFTLTDIGYHGGSLGDGCGFYAIEVDGVLLIDNFVANIASDSVVDVPSNGRETDTGAGGEVRGNYATLNPLDCQSANGELSNGNLNIKQTAAAWAMYRSTMFVSSGKWYWEVTIGNNQYTTIGICSDAYHMANSSNNWANAGSEMFGYYPYDGNVYNGSNTISYATGDTSAGGSIVGVALDMDNGTLAFYKNGTSLGQATSDLTGQNVSPTHWLYNQTGADSYNFGQHPFAYTAPSGYKALCTTNLPEPTIADGTTAMAVRAYPGNSGIRSISGFQFSPDWVWIKNRTSGNRHHLYDTVRGETKALATNYSSGETVENNGLTDFEADGFRLGTASDVNATGNNYIAWSWDAGANSSKTYAVTVVSDGGNKYRFDGHDTSAVTLDLEEGSTYTFDQSDSSNTGHPLRFSTTSDGTHGSGSEYTTGVVTNGTPGSAGAYTRITIAASAPALYYYCTAHSGMGGLIDTNSTAGATVLSGSLNSSLYASGRTWSSDLSASSLANQGKMFDWTYGYGSYTGTCTWTTTNAAYSSLSGRVYLANNTTVALTITFKDSGGATLGLYTLDWTGDGTEMQDTGFDWSSSVASVDITGGYLPVRVQIGNQTLVDTGTTVTNLPSINSIVRANPATGFSIVNFTSSNSQPDIIAHGLNAKPNLIIVKQLTSSPAHDWWLWHSALSDLYGDDRYVLKLNATSSTLAFSAGEWAPTSTTFTVDNSVYSGLPYVAYCFTAIEGYSAFGRYRGAGASTLSTVNQTFVYTGFKPQWLMIKRMDGTISNWVIFDRERNPLNPAELYLRPNVANGENTFAGVLHFKSNGFHLDGISSNNEINENAGDYLYIAFAEHPFASNCPAL